MTDRALLFVGLTFLFVPIAAMGVMVLINPELSDGQQQFVDNCERITMLGAGFASAHMTRMSIRGRPRQ